MTEHDDERKISQRYRELPREEPPAHLDEAIRAHARRMGATRPAPLVPPTGRRSWHYPAAAAAVLVLAVAVTWQVERAQPDPAEVVAVSPPPPAAQPETGPPPEVQARAEGRSAGPKAESSAPLRREAPARQRKDEPRFVPDAATRSEVEDRRAEAQGAPQAASPAAEDAPRALARQRSAETEAPEAWLERIARLRREGRHEEADKALAEFRKRFPAFKIPAGTLERIEKQ